MASENRHNFLHFLFFFLFEEQRKEEATNVRIKYPDRAPVIIERLHGSDIDDLDKRKFLVPSDLTIGQLIWIIRKRVKLPAEKALYVYVNRTIPVASTSVGEVYEEHKDEDSFLYICYSGESTFGNGKYSVNANSGSF